MPVQVPDKRACVGNLHTQSVQKQGQDKHKLVVKTDKIGVGILVKVAVRTAWSVDE